MKDISNLEYLKENSDYVCIDVEKIYMFLEKMDSFNYNYWLSDTNLFKTEKERIIFSFICESINFCFWECSEWTVDYKGVNYRGSEALFYSLLKAIENKKILMDIDSLIRIGEEEFSNIFKSGNETLSLLSERYFLFHETIMTIKKKESAFFNELFDIKNDVELVRYITSNFEHFNDESIFKGKKIHFNKRAILLANDLYNLSTTIRNNIKSIDNLTGCADYSIPKIFLSAGIFKYNNELMNKINSKSLIKHNSQMEIEIRGNTLYVIELMVEYLKNKKININSVQLDNIIWKTRREIKNDTPVHMTKCIYY